MVVRKAITPLDCVHALSRLMDCKELGWNTKAAIKREFKNTMPDAIQASLDRKRRAFNHGPV